jgi:hypothetical protein
MNINDDGYTVPMTDPIKANPPRLKLPETADWGQWGMAGLRGALALQGEIEPQCTRHGKVDKLEMGAGRSRYHNSELLGSSIFIQADMRRCVPERSPIAFCGSQTRVQKMFSSSWC